MKLKNLLLNISFWLHVLNVTQNNKVNIWSTEGPPDKKNKPCPTEYDQAYSSTDGSHIPDCTTQCSKGEFSHADADEWSSCIKKSGLYKYLGLEPKDAEAISGCENELEGVFDTNSFLKDTLEGVAHAKSPEAPDAESSNETIDYRGFHGQISLSQRTVNNEGNQGSVSTEKGSEDLPDPFSISMIIDAKAPETVYLFSEPVLDFESSTLLTNKTHNQFLP